MTDTPIYLSVVRDLDRPHLTVIPGDGEPTPHVHRPKGARLAILNGGTGVLGAVTSNA